MDEFIKVTEPSELIDNKGIVRRLDGDGIALVRHPAKNGIDSSRSETVSAFVNVCPHQHTPLVDKYGGQIVGNNLTCPMHRWTYDLKTGECVNVPLCGIPHSNMNSMMSEKSGKLKMLDVKIEGGGVFVKKITKEFDW